MIRTIYTETYTNIAPVKKITQAYLEWLARVEAAREANIVKPSRKP